MYNQIRQERIKAKKERNKIKDELLTYLLGLLENDEKRGFKIDDERVISLCKKHVTSINENIVRYNDEQKRVANEEISILEMFIPKQLSAEKLKEILVQNSITSVPDAMKFLKQNYAGLYDGKIASEVAKSL